MEAPPKFLEGLEKYFANDLEAAKELLNGDDVLSKSLLALVEVKLDDGSKNAEIQASIDEMDFKGNDIALMFCVLAQEYSLHMTKAHNLLLKRFSKEEKVISKEIPELAAKAEAKPDLAAKAEAKPELEKQTGGKRKTRKAKLVPSPSPSPLALPPRKRLSRGKA